MSDKPKNYCVSGQFFGGQVETFGEAKAIVERNGNGAVYQRCYPDPVPEVCERCGDDMVPEKFEGKVIGWGCPPCWDEWDRSNVVVGNFQTTLLPDPPKAA